MAIKASPRKGHSANGPQHLKAIAESRIAIARRNKTIRNLEIELLNKTTEIQRTNALEQELRETIKEYNLLIKSYGEELALAKKSNQHTQEELAKLTEALQIYQRLINKSERALAGLTIELDHSKQTLESYQTLFRDIFTDYMLNVSGKSEKLRKLNILVIGLTKKRAISLRRNLQHITSSANFIDVPKDAYWTLLQQGFSEVRERYSIRDEIDLAVFLGTPQLREQKALDERLNGIPTIYPRITTNKPSHKEQVILRALIRYMLSPDGVISYLEKTEILDTIRGAIYKIPSTSPE